MNDTSVWTGMAEELDMCDSMSQGKLTDLVNHPEHYQGKVECIEAMESFLSAEEFVGHCKACAFKYIWRCGKKDVEIQELSKAKWYIDKALTVLQK